MKVHELVDKYKQMMEHMRQEHEQSLWRVNRHTAYLQSLDPMTDVKPTIWDNYLVWDNKQRGKL